MHQVLVLYFCWISLFSHLYQISSHHRARTSFLSPKDYPSCLKIFSKKVHSPGPGILDVRIFSSYSAIRLCFVNVMAGELSNFANDSLLFYLVTSIVLYWPGPGIDRGHFSVISFNRAEIEYFGGLSSIVDFIGS